MKLNTTIEIEIKGVTHELSCDEFKQLHEDLTTFYNRHYQVIENDDE